MDEEIHAMWNIHTVEYYSALKRKEILTPATTRMNLENIRLSEISPFPKDKYCMVPTSVRFPGCQIHRDRK